VIPNDQVRWFLGRCAFTRGTAELKEDASGEGVWPIVADHTQEEHGRIDIAVVCWLRFEEVMH
jgi:hypothetical protein